MSSKLGINITLDMSDAQVQSALAQSQDLKYEQVQSISNLLQAIKSGAKSAIVELDIGAVAATGSVTLSSAATGSSATVNGEAINIDNTGTDAEKASALAEDINANANLIGVVFAWAESNVVQLRASVPGPLGNNLTLTVSGSGVTASAATLASGANGETRLLKFNLAH